MGPPISNIARYCYVARTIRSIKTTSINGLEVLESHKDNEEGNRCISHFDFLGQFFQVLNYRASNTGVECRVLEASRELRKRVARVFSLLLIFIIISLLVPCSIFKIIYTLSCSKKIIIIYYYYFRVRRIYSNNNKFLKI